MSKKLFFILATIILFLVLSSVGLAIYGVAYGGYTGIAGRERREYDPFSRIQYYGERDYLTYYPAYQFGGYGSKGPQTGTLIGTGSKSAYSGVFQLDTSAFQSQGRNPQKTSIYDPGMRGYSTIDKAVELYPLDATTISKDYITRIPRGTARILSLGGIYGAGQNTEGPESRVLIQLIDVPPAAENEIYEAWLVDEESGYPLSLGLMQVGIGGTARLNFEITRLLENFDYMLITKEPFPDINPTPGETVLFGEIPQPRTATTTPASWIPTTTR